MHTIAAFLAVFVLVLPGAADDPPTSRPTSRPAAAPVDTSGTLLGGPTVDQDPLLGDANGFRHFMSRQRGPNRVRPKAWLEAVRGLDLSDEQKNGIQGILDELTTRQREWGRQKRREMNQLRKTQREAREAGRNFPAAKAVRLQELIALEPKTEAYQERAWRLLTSYQRRTLVARLAGRPDPAPPRPTSRPAAPAAPPAIVPMAGPLPAPFDALPDAAERRLRFLLACTAPPKSAPKAERSK